MAQLAFHRPLVRPLAHGVLAAGLLASSVAGPTANAADLRQPIDGAARIMPQSFIAWAPARAPVLAAPGESARARALVTPSSLEQAAESPGEPAIAFWVMPLTDKVLSPAQRSRDLDASLKEALVRIVGLYDVLAGIDPSNPGAAWVDPGRGRGPALRRTTASYMDGIGPCEAYRQPRARRASVLTIVSTDECYALRRAEPIDLRGLAPSFMVSRADTAPIFAAPLPGARMSSETFWAAQKARIRSLEARLKSGWHERDAIVTDFDLQLSAAQ